MTTTHSAPNPSPEALAQGGPGEFHLHGHGVQISYYPRGAGPVTVEGPVVLVYQDADQTLTFRRDQVQTVDVEDLGTLVTVTLHKTPDAGTRTATLLVPAVVLGGQRSVPVQTELIRAVHISTLAGFGHPQRDSYIVSSVTGQASVHILPL